MVLSFSLASLFLLVGKEKEKGEGGKEGERNRETGRERSEDNLWESFLSFCHQFWDVNTSP